MSNVLSAVEYLKQANLVQTDKDGLVENADVAGLVENADVFYWIPSARTTCWYSAEQHKW